MVKNGNNVFGGYTEISWEDGKHLIKEIHRRLNALETLLGSFSNDDDATATATATATRAEKSNRPF